MIAEKRPPALTRRSAAPFHVLGDSGLSDLEAELQKLAMDARRAPERVIEAHLRGSAPAAPYRSAGALPYSGTSIASSCETQLDASEPASPAE